MLVALHVDPSVWYIAGKARVWLEVPSVLPSAPSARNPLAAENVPGRALFRLTPRVTGMLDLPTVTLWGHAPAPPHLLRELDISLQSSGGGRVLAR